VLLDAGRPDDAEPYLRSAYAARVRSSGAEHSNTLTVEANLGAMLRAQGKLEEAADVLRSRLAARRRVLGDDHPNVFETLDALSSVLRDLGRLDESARLGAETMERADRVLAPDHWHRALFRRGYARTLIAQSRFAQAEELLLEAQRITDAAFGATSDNARKSRAVLVELYETWNAAQPSERLATAAARWRVLAGPASPP